MACVKVEVKEDALARVYVYEDENLMLEIPVPPIELFLAFVKELDRLRAEVADAEAYVTILARAFWLLHQKRKETGFLWWRRSEAPKVDEEEALKHLEREVRSVEVAIVSLTPALFGLVDYAVGGNRRELPEGGPD